MRGEQIFLYTATTVTMFTGKPASMCNATTIITVIFIIIREEQAFTGFIIIRWKLVHLLCQGFGLPNHLTVYELCQRSRSPHYKLPTRSTSWRLPLALSMLHITTSDTLISSPQCLKQTSESQSWCRRQQKCTRTCKHIRMIHKIRLHRASTHWWPLYS